MQKVLIFGNFIPYKLNIVYILISPVQLPLHEPYFDLTLIRVTHTKNPIITSKTYIFTYLITDKANLLRILFSACDEWLVPIRSKYSPCHGDSRLLAISYSYSRITGYNPYLFYPIL